MIKIHLFIFLALCAIHTEAQKVSSNNFHNLDAQTKANAVEVRLNGRMDCSRNGDWRQLRDLGWQIRLLHLSDASCTEIPKNAMHSRHKLDTLQLPSDVQKIGSQAFYACTNLKGTLTIPAVTEEIGEMAFAECKSLEHIDFSGNKLKCIGSYAFAGCSGLRGKLVIPDGVTRIDDGAFYGCTGIKEIEIPASVTYIGAAAFAKCTSLKITSIYYGGNPLIGKDAFLGTGCRIVDARTWNEKKDSIHIIPAPNNVTNGNGVLTLLKKIKVTAPSSLSNEKAHLERIYAERTCADTRIFKTLDLKKGTVLAKLSTDGTLAPEAYTLRIDKNGIEIKGGSDAGVFYGIMSLEQLMTDSREVMCRTLPFIEIKDEPNTAVRELMIDPARHFIPFNDIKALVPEMARYKLNSLHLHLGDDQAWRMEIKAYPLLTSEKGTKRVGMDDMQEVIEGYYTQEQMRELVAYARKYHVMIVPEVEMPGHSIAAIHCYPWLTCGGKDVPIRTTCGVSNELLCASSERVYDFLGQVFREMCDIFPAPYFHIGGDEAGNPALGCWSHCNDCERFKKEHGMTANWQLQEYMFGRMIDTLHVLGKTPMFWYETDFKHIPSGCVTFAWRHGLSQKAIEAAIANNAKIMMCPGEHCYLDYPESRGDMPEVNWGMPVTSLKQTYALDPAWGNSEQFVKNNLFGVAGTLWSECINSSERISYMAYPRAMALAEAGWSRMQVRSWDDFMRRLRTATTDMQRRGVNFNNTFNQ